MPFTNLLVEGILITRHEGTAREAGRQLQSSDETAINYVQAGQVARGEMGGIFRLEGLSESVAQKLDLQVSCSQAIKTVSSDG